MRLMSFGGVLVGTLAISGLAGQGPTARIGDVFPPWAHGTLDIHQIATGRGNAAFTIFPDGTTMLVDAGDAGDVPGADARPDATRTPAQWITAYVKQMMEGREARIDYASSRIFIPITWGESTAPNHDRDFGTTVSAASRRWPRRFPCAR